jgi:uncharacterized membrane protein
MYSRVTIAGHPVHAMLVGIPVTFYATSFVCFCAHAFGAEALWFQIGVYATLAGVIAAAVTAIPGFIDWAYGIPLGTRAKSTGFVHMTLNLAALVVFVINLFLQWQHRLEAFPSTGTSVILSLVGVLLTGAAGFRGWALVQLHHVGVELTSEQEALEPRPTPEIEHRGSAPRSGQGQPSH